MNGVKTFSILVAVDGSISGNNAIKQAIAFAKKASCTVNALAVVPPFEGELDLTSIKNAKETFRDPGERILCGARDTAAETGISIQTFLAEGKPHEAIVDAALDQDCDLIVMGRRGLTRLERVFMGNVTARVIGYSPIDVLVMPYDSELKWDNILVAVDGSECSHVAANAAISLSYMFGGSLTILSVVDVPVEAYADASNAIDNMVARAHEVVSAVAIMANAAGIEASAHVRVGPTHANILHVADEANADIIAMGSHGQSRMKRFLMGSVAERVIGNAKCPVLVVRRH